MLTSLIRLTPLTSERTPRPDAVRLVAENETAFGILQTYVDRHAKGTASGSTTYLYLAGNWYTVETADRAAFANLAGEGWAVFNDDEIQRIDEDPTFPDDEAALLHVINRARIGDAIAKQAIAVHCHF